MYQRLDRQIAEPYGVDLQATRGADGQWRSTRSWVDDYLGARYRRVQR